MMPEQEPVTITIGGQEITILPAQSPVLMKGPAIAHAALVCDDIAELMNITAYTDACHILLALAQRRGLTPKGEWCLGTLPVDWPTWRDYLAPKVATQVETALAESDGHVQIFGLIDSAACEFIEEIM
jgi:hypothetical protein